MSETCPRCGEPFRKFQRISVSCRCGRTLVREDVRCVACRHRIARHQRIVTAIATLGEQQATLRTLAKMLNVPPGTLAHWSRELRRDGLLDWEPHAGRRPGRLCVS